MRISTRERSSPPRFRLAGLASPALVLLILSGLAAPSVGQTPGSPPEAQVPPAGAAQTPKAQAPPAGTAAQDPKPPTRASKKAPDLPPPSGAKTARDPQAQPPSREPAARQTKASRRTPPAPGEIAPQAQSVPPLASGGPPPGGPARNEGRGLGDRVFDQLNLGYQDGFYLQTPDERFLLQLNGMVQGSASFENIDETFAPLSGPRPGVDNVNFDIRTARIYTTGYLVDPRFSFQLAGEFPSDETPAGVASMNTGARLLDAFANYRFTPWLQLRAGQFKMPLSRQVLNHDWALQLPTRAIPATPNFWFPFFSFVPGREPGAMLWGNAGEGVVEYYAAISNGRGLNNDNNDTHVRFMARAVVNPLGPMPYEEGALEDGALRASAGLSYMVNTQTDPLQISPQDADVQTIATEGALRFGRLYVQGEGFLRDTSRKGGATDGTDWGWYGQAGVFLVPAVLEIVGRFDGIRFDPDVTQPVTLFPIAEADGVNDYTFGFNLYVDGHRLKIQGAYTLRLNDPAIGAHTDDHILELMLTVFF